MRRRCSAAEHHIPRTITYTPKCGWIREGTVELTVNAASYRLGPGSVGFAHPNDEHGIKNVGTNPATYFVAATGPGADT